MDCALSTAPDHSNLLVQRNTGATEKTRKSHILSGISPDGNYSVYNNTLNCSEKAVKERVFFVKNGPTFEAPPRPAPGLFKARLEGMYNRLKKNVKFSNPMSPEAFALSYQAPKQTVYLNAVASLSLKPYRARDAYIQAFTKCEKYKFSATKPPVPRIIQPRSPRYNVCVGRYLKPIEKKIYESINNIFGSTTIAKGLNVVSRAQVIVQHFGSFCDPVAVGLDASRFDQHVSQEALKWEHSIYDLYYHSPELRSLLKQQLTNKCFINQPGGHIRYKTDGCRMSGDMNTSLGNCLLMTSMVWAYSNEKSIPIRLINDGDDCVVFMERKHYTAFITSLPSWFLEMGFTMTVEDPVYILERVSFCSSNPVYTPGGYIMVRDPRKVIVKDNISLVNFQSPKVTRRWLSGVGKGGLAMCGGIPVLQEFYQTILNASQGYADNKYYEDRRLLMLGDGVHRSYSVPTPETRFSFYLAFGIDPRCQTAIEDSFRCSNLTYKSVDELHHIVLPMETL